MNALTVKDVVKVYGKKVHALKGVSLEVKEGDFFGLLGPNGAGKTTLIGIISGLVNKTGGCVKVFDYDVDKEIEKSKACFGVVAQELNVGIFEYVLDVACNAGGFYGLSRSRVLKRVEIILKKLKLWDKRNSKVKELSGGMKRRLMIAKALIHKPKLLILDEPTTGIDVELRNETWKFLKELNKNGTTIILTTHYLEEAEYLCNNIAIIDKGIIKDIISTKKLQTKLNKRTFIVDTEKSIEKLKSKKFEIRIIDSNTFEVDIKKKDNINEFFKFLDSKKVKVIGFRNKQNALEQLFIEVLNHE